MRQQEYVKHSLDLQDMQLQNRGALYEAGAAAMHSDSCFCTAMQKKIIAEHMRVISVIQRVMNQAGSDQRKASKKQPHHIPCDVKVRLQLQP